MAATPLARRIAGQHDVDLAALTGSGPRGRIVKADVLAAAGLEAQPPRRPAAATNGAATAQPTPAPAAPEPAPATGAEGSRIEPLTRLQQVVARRMAEAKATVPEFQVQTEVDMGAAINGDIVDRHLLTLTLTCDHRILYGADAARFLADIKALLETPLRAAL